MRALLLFAVLAAPAAAAQTTLAGRVTDAATGETLPGANVLAVRLAADSLQTGVASDLDGRFALRLAPGTYRLRVSYAGYAPDVREVVARGAAVDLGEIALAPAELGEVQVDAVRERVTLRGDTTAFNASAFPTTPDATAEDLVARLPGVVVQDGQVQAQGETVQRVLVDGEEFFGDPSTALRNLPADVVQEIQVFERQSDQARFTGFDDGNAEQTINIVTRADRRAEPFGRLYGGGGSDWAGAGLARYSTGATVHWFDGARRLSAIGQANNVNQQNFAAEDLLGVVGESGGGGRGGRGRGGRGGDAGTYLVGEQDGLTNTAALGVNYADRWGEGVRVSGSYFANRTGTTTDARLDRDYVVAEDLFYTETSAEERANANHRFSGRLEADLSDATQLTVRPRLSVQRYDAENAVDALSRLAGQADARNVTASLTDGTGYAAAGDLLLRHRFATPGRTLSLRLEASQDGRDSATDQDVRAFAGADTTDAYRRQLDANGTSREVEADVRLTEAIGARGQIEVHYEPGFRTQSSAQDAFFFDPATGAFSVPDSLFTSVSEQRVTTQRGGVGVRFNGERLRANAELDVQHERLDYTQAGARPFTVDRTLLALLPSASLRYEFSERSRLDLRYRAGTRAPGVSQLTTIVDDTNPLLVTAGNPDLQTSREHRLDLRLRSTQPTAGAVAFGSLQLTATQDYVGQSVTVAGAEPVTVGGVTLQPGAQLVQPVNLDGYLRARAFGSLGRPIPALGVNANVTGGVTLTRTPSLYNDALNRADAVAVDARTSVSTSVSPRLDARLGYGVSWTSVANSARATADDTFLRHQGTLAITWLPTGGLVLSSDLDLTAYTGVDAGVAPTAATWNAGLGYKFLPGDRAEVRLTAHDLLDRNAAVRQTVTDTYVQTSETQSLGRHLLLTLSYRLSTIGQAPAATGRGRR